MNYSLFFWNMKVSIRYKPSRSSIFGGVQGRREFIIINNLKSNLDLIILLTAVQQSLLKYIPSYSIYYNFVPHKYLDVNFYNAVRGATHPLILSKNLRRHVSPCYLLHVGIRKASILKTFFFRSLP